MATPVTLQTEPMTPRPARVGRYVVAAACVLATALAFGIAYVTTDWSLPPKQRLALEQIRRLEGVFKMYHRSMGRFPLEEEGFEPLIQAKVLTEVPVDPWGHPYVYRFNNEHTGVLSFGADGVPGGEGENADITSGGLWRPRQ
ncbi:type II secretion system protein GspG [Hyalangium minutum]|uniref:General secretion pathway protein G n=1 Tax=Hyalangium minutum TaxID=394096 RepID=A0A085W6H1_9BACT|nr:type II secretion system protein GspG [Hyalangium minutum]KFE63284.1 General secretion pathway protein G [Hyalangium minutum]